MGYIISNEMKQITCNAWSIEAFSRAKSYFLHKESMVTLSCLDDALNLFENSLDVLIVRATILAYFKHHLVALKDIHHASEIEPSSSILQIIRQCLLSRLTTSLLTD